MFVKICGMTSPDAVAAAVAAGADAVGFVFADSPREVTPAQARALCAGLPPQCLRVAVMHHPSPERLARVIDGFAPDWIQTDAEDFDALALPAGCGALPVYRNGRLPAAASRPPRLLFEGAVSGSGTTADWDEARALTHASELVLAGGLTPDNVAAAIEYVQPWGVDVSSGVERSRGVKDPARITQFVARVRAMEKHR
jgi:phosphoribosylanthranilate isomerase